MRFQLLLRTLASHNSCSHLHIGNNYHNHSDHPLNHAHTHPTGTGRKNVRARHSPGRGQSSGQISYFAVATPARPSTRGCLANIPGRQHHVAPSCLRHQKRTDAPVGRRAPIPICPSATAVSRSKPERSAPIRTRPPPRWIHAVQATFIGQLR